MTLHDTATRLWKHLPHEERLAAAKAFFAGTPAELSGVALGAAYALHIVASVSVMAEARDLQKAVGSGDGAWFASSDGRGRGQLRGGDGKPMDPAAPEQFIPTVYLYDAYPGGIGLSEPLYHRRAELVARARALLDACDCRAGCPACAGPVLAADESLVMAPKQLAARVLALLNGAGCAPAPEAAAHA